MSIGFRALKSWCVLGLAGAITVSATGCTASLLGNHDPSNEKSKAKKTDRASDEAQPTVAPGPALLGDESAHDVAAPVVVLSGADAPTGTGAQVEAPKVGAKDWLKFPSRTADDGSVTNPVFKGKTIARMKFSPKGDQRSAKEKRNHQINEAGIITGTELLRVTRPAAYADYEMGMRFQGQEGKANWAGYQEYLKNLADGGIALLALNRIIDQESVKRRLSTEVSEELVEYVIDSILYENMSVLVENERSGASKAKEEVHRRGPVCPISLRKPLKFDCNKLEKVGKDGPSLPSVVCDLLAGDLTDLALTLGEDELYAWLRKAIGTQVMTLKIDWSYREGHLGAVHDKLARKGELDWLETKLELPTLPEKISDFRAVVRKELNARHETNRRMSAWRALLQQEFPTLQMTMLMGVSSQELDEYYELAKDRMLVKDLKAKVTRIDVSGEKAKDFQARFKSLLDLKGKAVLDAIVAQFPRGTRPTEEQKKEIQEKMAQLSVEAPRAAFAEAKDAFAADIASGQVVVRYAESTLEHKGDEALVSEETQGTAEAKLRQFAFTKPFMKAPVHLLEATGDDCVVTTIVQHEVIEGEARRLGADHAKVEELLRQQILSKKQGAYFRELAYRLFRRNPVELTLNTCSDKAWPCASTDPRRMAEVLFQESYFPVNGQPRTALKNEQDQVVSSSLGNDGLLRQVVTISGQSLDAALKLPNKPQDILNPAPAPSPSPTVPTRR